MQFILKVPVKPYIKKYIGAEYPVEPYFDLTTTNRFGLFLFHCLSKPDKSALRLITDESEEDLAQKFTDLLLVRVTEKKWGEKGRVFTPQAIVHFNKFCMMDFNTEFFRYVHNRIGPKGSINQAIMNFRDNYGICEDELAFRTIQRAFQRRNAQLKKSA